MYFDELIRASLAGRNFVDLERDCGRYDNGEPIVKANNLRDFSYSTRKWATHLDPITTAATCRGLGVKWKVNMAAQSRSIFRWHSEHRPELAPHIGILDVTEEESRLLALTPPGTDVLDDFPDLVDAIRAQTLLNIEHAHLRRRVEGAK